MVSYVTGLIGEKGVQGRRGRKVQGTGVQLCGETEEIGARGKGGRGEIGGAGVQVTEGIGARERGGAEAREKGEIGVQGIGWRKVLRKKERKVLVIGVNIVLLKSQGKISCFEKAKVKFTL